MLHDSEPATLRPYNAVEALTVRQAAALAKRSVRTIREWAARFDLGRRISGSWQISHVALLMHLEGNHEALVLYHRGDRSSPAVTDYFTRLDVPISRQGNGFRETALSEVIGACHHHGPRGEAA
jgi:hypothetical protein